MPHPGFLPVLAVLATLLLSGAGRVPAKLPVIEKLGHANYFEKFGDDVKFEMIAIPGGSFLMGSAPEEKGRKADEGPQHPVQVRPFWMGKCEVTWEEFEWRFPDGYPRRPLDLANKPAKVSEAIRLSDATTGPSPFGGDPTFGYGRAGQPCIGITHHAAMNYCRWLSEKTGKTYRLPTEAEWEWACRAGTTTAFSFGDDPKKMDDYAWTDSNAEDRPHKVGLKKPNRWGLHDMHGNVAEWVIDRYRQDYYKTLPTDQLSLNPFHPPTEHRYGDAVRGGSWIDAPADCRSSARRFSDKSWSRRDPGNPKSIWWLTEADYVGFRVVRPVEEYDNLRNLRSKVTWWSD